MLAFLIEKRSFELKEFWKGFYTVESKWKVLIKPISTWCLNRVQVVFYMDFIFQNIQSFLFLINKDLTRLFKKRRKRIWLSVSHLRKKVWAFKEKKNRVLWVCVIDNFQAWHHRISLYLTIAWVRSIVVRRFFISFKE